MSVSSHTDHIQIARVIGIPIHLRFRVLLMSGYADRQLDGNALIEPGTPFLSKPFTIDPLLREVRGVLDRDGVGK